MLTINAREYGISGDGVTDPVPFGYEQIARRLLAKAAFFSVISHFCSKI